MIDKTYLAVGKDHSRSVRGRMSRIARHVGQNLNTVADIDLRDLYQRERKTPKLNTNSGCCWKVIASALGAEE